VPVRCESTVSVVGGRRVALGTGRGLYRLGFDATIVFISGEFEPSSRLTATAQSVNRRLPVEGPRDPLLTAWSW
jgi:hypothetical protein